MSDCSASEAPEQRGRAVRVQIVANYLPLPGTSGSHSYMRGLVRHLLREGLDVGYVLIDTFEPQVVPTDVRELVDVAVVRRPANLLARVVAVLSQAARRLPQRFQQRLQAAYHFAADQGRNLTLAWHGRLATASEGGPPWWAGKVLAHVLSFDPDILIADYVWHAGIFDVLPSRRQPLKVILTHDVIHRHGETLRQTGASDAYREWTWDSEARQLQKADLLLAIQNEEASVLKQMVPECEVLVVPMDATGRVSTGRRSKDGVCSLAAWPHTTSSDWNGFSRKSGRASRSVSPRRRYASAGPSAASFATPSHVSSLSAPLKVWGVNLARPKSSSSH